MSDVDYQGGNYLILDRTRMQLLQLGFSVVAILFFIIYALLLRDMCLYTDTATSSLLLLSIQVVVGIIATRASQTLGQKSGTYLSIIDPSRLIRGWKHVEVKVPLGTISQLFERFTNMVGTDEKVADDIIDIAWFVILTWSVVSTALAVTFEHFHLLCSLGSLIVGVASAFCYHNGFQIGSKKDFDEDLEHLAFYIKARLSEFYKRFEPAEISVYMRLLVAGSKLVLSDVGVGLESIDEPSKAVHYWIGLSSDRPECIEIRTTKSEQDSLAIEDLPVIESLKWNQSKLSSGYAICNPLNKISLHDASSYLRRTSATDEGVEDIVDSIDSICILEKIRLDNARIND